MPKATIKRAFFILLALTAVFLAGCSDPDARRAERIDEARELQAAGESDAALALLEELSSEFPNDSEILALIGNLHAEAGDTVSAAFYLEQAYRHDPDDTELLYQTYRAQEAADQPADETLETLAEKAPDTLSPALWVRLGEYRAEAKKTQAALDAYLRGVDPESDDIEPATAVSVGQLFLSLDNFAQAERWFAIAADSDDPAALTALFGTLEIQLRRKEWADAEATIKRLDKQFPGAVDASQWSNARTELEKWRAAREKMRADLARREAADQQAEAEADEADQPDETEAAPDPQTASDTEPPADDADTEGKAQIVADLEAAEAMADTPAVDALPDPSQLQDPDTIAFDPDIAVEPADPDLGINVSFDQEGDASVTYRTADDADESDESATAASPEAPPAGPTPPAREARPARDVDELLAEAETATRKRDFKPAINLLWQALGQANARADIWNRLSQAYLLDGQTKSAETAALEAVRLAPDDIAYALDYLRVAQRTKSPREFLGELETTYARFPRNPEVTLSLARAYERISQNYEDARTLYSRFLELAPNHPLRPEATEAVNRLR